MYIVYELLMLGFDPIGHLAEGIFNWSYDNCERYEDNVRERCIQGVSNGKQAIFVFSIASGAFVVLGILRKLDQI